jgi:hypothetical protein
MGAPPASQIGKKNTDVCTLHPHLHGIEGVVGITVDKSDSFYIHINLQDVNPTGVQPGTLTMIHPGTLRWGHRQPVKYGRSTQRLLSKSMERN